MDERTYGALRVFKRRGALYIAIPALVVALLVSIGISFAFLQSFGRSMASGLNGVIAGSMDSPGALENPLSLGELQGDLEALRHLGQFARLTVKSADERVLAETGNDEPATSALDAYEQRALDTGRMSAYIGRCDCDDYEFMVVGPLTRATGETPYGVVRGHREISTILPFLTITVLALVIVVLGGAAVAVGLLRRMVNRTEEVLEEDQRVIDALDSRLAHSLNELEEHSIGTLQALVAAVDARDTYTAHHSMNVSDYACAIARQMGLTDHLGDLERAGLLHDIGKIGIAENTLLKPGRLTPEEFSSIKEHSEIGARIIEMAPFLTDIVPVIRHHHERWDGSGYPTGLVGEETPLLARILGVADALDAMTTDRAYRSALSVSRARQELVDGRGKQFDPEIVDAALSLLDTRTLVIPRRFAYAAATA